LSWHFFCRKISCIEVLCIKVLPTCAGLSEQSGYKMDKEVEILDEVYNTRDNFLARVGQELKRAQRYLNFLSYIDIDATRLNKKEDVDISRTDSEFYRRIKKHIRSCIRQTDIMSGFSNGRICLLLVDTPRKGAEVVKQRLQQSIKYFLHEKVRSPLSWRTVIESGSFPDDEMSPNSFYEKVNSFLSR